jgi:hypothetical protein
MIERGAIQPIAPGEEEVQVDALGDSVLVRALVLSRSLAFTKEIRELGPRHVPKLLAETVLAADGLPVYTAGEWDAFGTQHIDDTMNLYKVACRLSGLDEDEAEKKAPNPP